MTEQQRDLDKEFEKKFYFCPKCKKYPDKIVEIYDWFAERRKWNEELGLYELESTDNGDCHVECGVCGRNCEERPQVKEDGIK